MSVQSYSAGLKSVSCFSVLFRGGHKESSDGRTDPLEQGPRSDESPTPKPSQSELKKKQKPDSNVVIRTQTHYKPQELYSMACHISYTAAGY